ncbi:MAG: D-sedoheptulose-7-phosphate isomerase [Phycisphaerales bacterium]
MPQPDRTVTFHALHAAAGALNAFMHDSSSVAKVEQAIDELAACFTRSCKVMACGNGGSLCDAAHFAEELTGRFRKNRPALPAIAITEPGHLTCTANDFGFDHVFSRAVEALGRPGDMLVALSTSGNSTNVRLALEAGRARGMFTLALLGKGGGACAGAADLSIVVPGETSDRIQELHMLILHTLVEGVESRLGYA